MNRPDASEFQRIYYQKKTEARWQERQRGNARANVIYRFLKEHPGSTATEVWQATGFGTLGNKFVHSRKDGDVTRWYFNQEKWDKFVNNEEPK